MSRPEHTPRSKLQMAMPLDNNAQVASTQFMTTFMT